MIANSNFKQSPTEVALKFYEIFASVGQLGLSLEFHETEIALSRKPHKHVP